MAFAVEPLIRAARGADDSGVRSLLDREYLVRVLPFAIVAVAGQLSAAWPPGSARPGFFWSSSALLVATALMLLLGRRALPGAGLVSAATYVASVALLMLATGGVSSGLGSLLLISVVAIALYGRRSDSVAIVTAVIVALLVVSLASPHVDAPTARRLIFFGSLAAMISFAIHVLRCRLAEAQKELQEHTAAEERRRIARELHDGLAHELAFIASKAKGSARRPDAGPDMKELAGAADRALDEARRAITVLSSPEPQSLALAVAQTAEDLGGRLGLDVRLELDDALQVPGAVTENLLRILREAMTNAANHGASHTVDIVVRADQGGLHMVIEDDGYGFDPAGPRGVGFGLVSMQERAHSLGASLMVVSAPARGTTVEVTLP